MFKNLSALDKSLFYYGNILLLLVLGLSLVFTISFELVNPTLTNLTVRSICIVGGLFLGLLGVLTKKNKTDFLFYTLIGVFYFFLFHFSTHQFYLFVTVLSINIFLSSLLFNLGQSLYFLSFSIFIYTLQLSSLNLLWNEYSVFQYLSTVVTFAIYTFIGLSLKEFVLENKTKISNLKFTLSKESALNDSIVASMGSAVFLKLQNKPLEALNNTAKEWNHITTDLETLVGKEITVYELEKNSSIFSIRWSPLYVLGEKKGEIFLVSDETEAKKMEKELEQSRKLAAVGTLSAGLAHEIRNPLAGMSGSLELLKEGEEDAEISKKLFNSILKEVDRLNSLVTDFLNFSKPTVQKNTNLEIKDFFRELLRQVQLDPLSENIEIVENLENQTISADEDKLKQVFMNFLMNSLQAFSSERKKTLKENGENPEIKITSEKSRSKYSLTIADNGSGIPKEELNKIFEPFHTTKDKGTGLGLALSHRILSEHDASISVDSIEGQGTAFKITFKL